MLLQIPKETNYEIKTKITFSLVSDTDVFVVLKSFINNV